jgi:gluconate 5-dehydrogenase
MIQSGRGGRVINIGSIESTIALAEQASYVASKGGLRMLTRAMALEWAPYGITVNGVGPGVIDTGMTPSEGSEFGRWLLGNIPMGRPGRPEDVGAVVRFLASDEARHITGTMVYVDGGWLLR